MKAFRPSADTSEFEIAAAFNGGARLSEDCATSVRECLDRHGFAIVDGLLARGEADAGLGMINQTLENPERQVSQFASETDSNYHRRNFCSLPSTPESLHLASSICKRLEPVISEYCGHSRSLLEITTLTSHQGSSHQYIHRDPDAVLSMLVAVEDIGPDQGGTLFVPGTHKFGGANIQMGGRAFEFMELYRIACNARILLHNLASLVRMRRRGNPGLEPGEFRDRTFSRRQDDHQPNLLRFLVGKTYQFNLGMLGPGNLWKLFRHRKLLEQTFRMVRTAPRKGSVILFRSDLMHAGGDNLSHRSRKLLSLSIARDRIYPEQWALSYSPDPTLRAHPVSYGDLLKRAEGPGPAKRSSIPFIPESAARPVR